MATIKYLYPKNLENPLEKYNLHLFETTDCLIKEINEGKKITTSSEALFFLKNLFNLEPEYSLKFFPEKIKKVINERPPHNNELMKILEIYHFAFNPFCFYDKKIFFLPELIIRNGKIELSIQHYLNYIPKEKRKIIENPFKYDESKDFKELPKSDLIKILENREEPSLLEELVSYLKNIFIQRKNRINTRINFNNIKKLSSCIGIIIFGIRGGFPENYYFEISFDPIKKWEELSDLLFILKKDS